MVSHHRMEAGQGAALQHVVQRSRKEIFNAPRTDVLHRSQPQLKQGAAVGRQNLTVGIHGQLTLMQRENKFGPTVEMQWMCIAESSINQAIFNHARRHSQHHKQVLLHHAGATAYIKHCRDLARGVIDRHGRTSELSELVEKMVLTVNPYRTGCGQARAHAVRARHFLAPDAARPQTKLSCISRKFRRRNHVDDHAIGISQHDGRLDVSQLLIENGHLMPGASDQIGQPRATCLQITALDKFWRAGFGWIQAVFIDTATPGLGHHIAFLLPQSTLDLRQDSMRVVAGVLHHRWLPLRYLTGTIVGSRPGKYGKPTSRCSIER